jgi:hypothetical protein
MGMRLESGPAKAERNWQLLRTFIFLGFALFFAYDGAIGYPNKNRREAEAKLATPSGPFKDSKVTFDSLGETPTKADFEALLRSKPTNGEQARAALGSPTFASGSDEYFMSRYGYAKISIKGGRATLSPTDWTTWFKDKSEVQAQFYWAIIPALPGLFFLRRLIQAVTLRVTIDDEGMVYAGQRIPFDSMVSLRDYSPKGWIDLYYQVGEGEKKLRLDNEKVKLFDEIVAALCTAKGFRNEVQEYAEKKAREEAEEDEAEPAASETTDEQEQDSA